MDVINPFTNLEKNGQLHINFVSSSNNSIISGNYAFFEKSKKGKKYFFLNVFITIYQEIQELRITEHVKSGLIYSILIFFS